MKSIKKILVLLLSVCMLGLAITMSVIAGTPDDFTMEVDKTEVNVGDTVTVAISNVETEFSAMTLVMKFDNSILQCTALTNVDGEDGDDDLFMYYLNSKGKTKDAYPDAGYCTVDEINEMSQFQFLILGTEDLTYLEGDVVIFEFEAIKEGTCDISLKTTVVDAVGEISETVSETITVTASAPACNHNGKTYTYASNNDGTHKVICECGETANAAETCSGGTPTCTAKAICAACSDSYGSTAEHSFNTKASAQEKTPADCTNAATYYVQCDNCDAVSDTKTVAVGTENGHAFNEKASTVLASAADCINAATYYVQCDNCDVVSDTKTVAVGTENGHAFNEKVSSALASAADCTNAATYYVQCDNCDAVSDTKTVAVGEANGHGKVLGFRYTSNGDNTHTKYCNVCDAPIEGEANVACSGGTATCAAQATCDTCKTGYGELDAKNHIWGEVDYQWTGVDKNKNAKVKAVRTCTVHTDAVETATGTVTSKNVTGDCKLGVHNKIIYTATFTVDWATKQTATYEYPGQAHTHLIYTDNLDGTTHHVECECGNYTPRDLAHSYNKKTHKCACGAMEPTGWIEKNGTWYYVNEDYTNATGLALVPYPETAINGITYAPNAEDIAYAESNGTEFAFAEKAYFFFTNEGEFAQITGMMTSEGVLTYIENGMAAWHPGFVTYENELYYFVGDKTCGNVAANGLIYVTRNAEAAGYKSGDRVYFENGKVAATLDGVVGDYYYENGKIVKGAGLVKLENGKYIFVRSAGQLAKGEYWVTAEKANGLVNGDRIYVFDENGYMTTEIDKNGIVDGKYYVEGKLTYAGLIEIDDDYYYVRSNGELAKGWYYVTKTNGIDLGTTKLFFDENGKMETIMNGFIDGIYYENNHIVYGLVKVGEDYYYIRSNGKAHVGYYYIFNTNGIEGFQPGDLCKFDKDGKLIFNAGQE